MIRQLKLMNKLLREILRQLYYLRHEGDSVDDSWVDEIK